MSGSVAVVVFPGTNSEIETVDACRDAGIDARLHWWSDPPEPLRAYDGYVMCGGFAHEDRVRAGAIAARSEQAHVIKEEAAKGKLVLGLCNGAQVVAESGMLGPVAIARNQPTGHFICRFVDVVTHARPERCAFTRGLSPNSSMRMVIAHGEGRFTASETALDELEADGRIVLAYAGEAPQGSARRAAGVCNAEGNVLALMPHPERTAWAFNHAAIDLTRRGGDPNRTAASHAIFQCMARALSRRRGIVW